MGAETQAALSERENKMGTAPVWSLLLKMALPIILSTAVQSLYNIVDGIFVSRISEEAMTAITLATPITIILMAVGTGIRCYRHRRKRHYRKTAVRYRLPCYPVCPPCRR